jgi:hypothetical protein
VHRLELSQTQRCQGANFSVGAKISVGMNAVVKKLPSENASIYIVQSV